MEVERFKHRQLAPTVGPSSRSSGEFEGPSSSISIYSACFYSTYQVAWCTVVSRSNHVEAATHHPDSSRHIYQAYSHQLWTAIRRHVAGRLTANQRPAVITTEVRAELVSACEQIGSRLSPLTKSRWSPTAICWCTCTDLPHCHTWSSRWRRQKEKIQTDWTACADAAVVNLFVSTSEKSNRLKIHAQAKALDHAAVGISIWCNGSLLQLHGRCTRVQLHRRLATSTRPQQRRAPLRDIVSWPHQLIVDYSSFGHGLYVNFVVRHDYSSPAARTLPLHCRAPRLLVTRPHRLYVNLTCSGSTSITSYAATTSFSGRTITSTTISTSKLVENGFCGINN
jgi:hypothetical protein